MMKRIPALDSIRGLLLLLMTLNHLFWISGGSSALTLFTQQPLGQFGAAAGFILLSGFLSGAIYSKPASKVLGISGIQSTPDKQGIVRKAWGRAFTIYRYHLVCLLIVFGWIGVSYALFPAVYEVLIPNMPSLKEAPLSSVILSGLLINKPNYLDILPLYILFLLGLPFCIIAYRKGLMWLVLLLSFSVWGLSSYITESQLQSVFGILPVDLAFQVGYFDPFAWQFLFIGGSACGYMAHNPNFRWYYIPIAIACAVAAAVLFAMHHGAFLAWGIHPGVLYAQADKPELGWLRIVNVSVWAYLVAVVIHHRPTWLQFKLFSYIGRHSLQVFTWHIVLIYLVAPLLFANRFEPFYDVLIILCAATIWIPAWAREQKEDALRVRRWVLGCGGTIVAAVVMTLIIKPEAKPEVVADAQGLAPLTVMVKNIQDTGPVILLVYGENDNLMGMPSIHAQGYSVEEVTAGVEIAGIPEGNYAIFTYQDVDSNNQLTMGAGGMPAEGFGYSTNPALQGMPTIEQIQFAHPQEAHQVIQLVNL